MWIVHDTILPYNLRQWSKSLKRLQGFYGETLNELRTDDLLCASDYSGGDKEYPYYVASFLVMPISKLVEWDQLRTDVRKKHLSDGRTMSFKKLGGDVMRQNALAGFLNAADSIPGLVISFAIEKKAHRFIWPEDEARSILSESKHHSDWKPLSYRKMLILAALYTMIAGALLAKHKDIFWVTDDDDFTHSHDRMLDLARLLHILRSTNMPKHTGEAEVQAASRMENKVLENCFEDLCAIPDLIAGSLSEMISKTHSGGMKHWTIPREVQHESLSPKTGDLIDWQSKSDSKLKKAFMIAGCPEGRNDQMIVNLGTSFESLQIQ